MPHKVCILIFTCNRPEDLRRALDSVVRQRFKDLEAVVIDNGDSSLTDALLKNYPFRVIKDNTKRLSYLFNLGWKSSDADYLGYVADDAELDPDWIVRGMESFSRNPQAALVTGPLVSPFEFTGEMHALHVRAKKNFFLRIAAYLYDKFILEGKTFEPCVLCESGSYTLGQGFKPDFSEERRVDLATTSSMMIRRTALEKAGGFDEHFIFNHADGDLFVRLRKQGYEIIYNPAMQAVHYVRMGPSRYPYYIGRDTAYFYLKDIRPRSVRGALAMLANLLILNAYWVYKTAQTGDIQQLKGITGFVNGVISYINARP